MSWRVIHSPEELLAAVDRDSVFGLSDVLTTHADIEVSIKEWEPTHLEIYAAGFGIELAYPFALAELWEAADELTELTLPE